MQSIAKTHVAIVGDDGSGLDPFIDIANDMVTRLCTSSNYSATTLELIERVLSAHYYASLRDKTLQRTNARAGDVGDTFDLQLAPRLGSTVFGQQVMVIDTAGNLAAADRRAGSATPQAGVEFLGREHGRGYGGWW